MTFSNISTIINGLLTEVSGQIHDLASLTLVHIAHGAGWASAGKDLMETIKISFLSRESNSEFRSAFSLAVMQP
jgi:hypothetical protein